ncbi:MAG: outer membrane lipoprotein carrier protein LolA [Gammaproteobacteria bacterium]|nr:MAG: outer membrane lipoprotein carrier protein LolA [Gammaproteobacteria bacterium]
MKLLRSLLLMVFISHGLVVTSEETAIQSDILETELSEALQKLNGYLTNLESYEANFQQKLSGSSRMNAETVSGRFLMKRPDRFRWQINSPYEQTIIADGKSIWTVDNDLEQVTVSDIEASVANSPIMLISRKNNQLDRMFSVIELESKTNLVKFLLKPKDSSSNFEFILLGFEDGFLKLIELNDSLGQSTRIVMTNVRNNPIISNAEFVYQEIADFDVLDSRAKSDSGD